MTKPQIIGPAGDPVELVKWFKHAYWDVEQAAKLLVGLDPAGTVFRESENRFGHPIVILECAIFLDGTEFDCTDFDDDSEEQKQVSVIEKNYVQLHDIMTSGYISRSEPNWFVRWADKKEISIPWRQWAESKGLIKGIGTDANAEPDKPKALGSKERETVLKIIAGFLLQGFKTAEIGKPYTVAKEIQQSLQSAGLSLSDDTVAKWIKDAAAIISDSKKSK